MASVTDVTIGATSTSIITAAMWETLGGPVYLKNESDTIMVLTISSADTYDLDPGEPIQVLPGQVVTGTAAGGSKKLQIIAGIMPADESASKGPGSSATSPSYVSAVITGAGLAVPAGGPGQWSSGQDDFTAAWLSAGSLTLGAFPAAMGTPVSGDFFLVIETLASGEHKWFTPDEYDMTLAAQVLTVTGGTFVSGSTFNVFAWGTPREHDASTNSKQSTTLNPDHAYGGDNQQSASGLADVTTNKYWSMRTGGLFYSAFGLQITDVAGIAGTNEYKIYTSLDTTGTAQESAGYIDRTEEFTGQASITSAQLVADPTLASIQMGGLEVQFIKLEQVRTLDGANTDGGFTYDAGWS